MKMDKNNENEFADLVIDVTDRVYKQYKIDIMDLSRGDEIQFNSTIRILNTQGSGKATRVELIHFKKTGNKINIEPHIHTTGRYSTHSDKVTQGKQVYSELPDVVSSEDKSIKQKESTK